MLAKSNIMSGGGAKFQRTIAEGGGKISVHRNLRIPLPPPRGAEKMTTPLYLHHDPLESHWEILLYLFHYFPMSL